LVGDVAGTIDAGPFTPVMVTDAVLLALACDPVIMFRAPET
jgi:hypothetical protein